MDGAGHYYSVVRHRGAWFSANDTQITPLSSSLFSRISGISGSRLAEQQPWTPPVQPSNAFSVYPISYHDLTLGEADYPVNRQQATLSPTPFEDSLRDDMHNGLRDDIHDDLHDDIQDDIQGQFSTLLDEVLPPPEKQSTPCSAPFISGIVNGIASL